MKMGDLAELVRAPAAMTVPGDSWSGAAHLPAGSGGWLMPLSSTCLYWSGMAFNDWCDRVVDADERPERPIPSGRVSPPVALAVAAGLGAAGVAISAVVGGRRALGVSLPLAALICAYDGVAKDSPAGPFVMASTRCLDVLLGAYAGPAHAWAPALAMGTHTVGLTTLSRGEVHGTTPGVAAGVTATTLAVAAGTTYSALRDPGASRRSKAVTALLATAYAAVVGRAQARAVADPSAGNVRAATRTGIGGFTLLQGAWLAGRGRLDAAALVVAGGPLLKAASKRMSPT